MSTHSSLEVHDQAALYAVGALPGEEAREFEGAPRRVRFLPGRGSELFQGHRGSGGRGSRCSASLAA
jgi:hypothetical protein